MSTTLSPTNIANMALARIGGKMIANMSDVDDQAALACKNNWQLSIAETARSHGWNCLLKSAVLVAQTQTPIDPTTTPTSTAWAPLTLYTANEYVTFGGALYQALITATSTANFTNDLTAGLWFETDIWNSDPFGDANSLANSYPSGWAYKYALPADNLLVVTLNDNPRNDCGPEEEYQIMGRSLYTNESEAVIKYVHYTEDTTLFDSLFAASLVLNLASKIATTLRQDDTDISTNMWKLYQASLRDARTTDAGEKKPRRFSPVANSRFVASRRWSTNG